jgi:uncharacterized protein YecT (DUF1311 family)
MKSLRYTILYLTIVLNAYASNCDNPQQNFDKVYCLNKVYMEADTELNTQYKILYTKLDHNAKNMLKNTQLQWIQERNQTCTREDANKYYADLECLTSSTILRTQFLQNRIRECKSTGCQNSKI